MIGYIRGFFHPMPDGTVIIESSSGIGFAVNVPSGSVLFKEPEGAEVRVFTSMQVREDDISLYGFTDREDLELFELLITVKGIGAKGALSIMSTLPGSMLGNAISSGDVDAISRANGIGKKTAERAILELKDKVGPFTGGIDSPAIIDDTPGDPRSEAVSALIALGYTRNEASSAVAKIKGENMEIEDYIKQALTRL